MNSRDDFKDVGAFKRAFEAEYYLLSRVAEKVDALLTKDRRLMSWRNHLEETSGWLQLFDKRIAYVKAVLSLPREGFFDLLPEVKRRHNCE